jgi:hypothetical protein
MSAAPVAEWPLTEAGKEQARQAGLAIAARLDGAKVTVFFWPEAALRYRQTARIIADVLDVPTVNCYLSHSPGTYDLPVLEQFEGPVVIVTNGTHLTAELRRYPGPEVTLGVLGPPHGSVHELVITYCHTEFKGLYRVLSRRFV